MAEKYQCAILGIRHLNKAQKGSALHRGLGSVDFTAFARSQLLIGRHNNQTVLTHVKSSLTQHGSSLAFEVKDGRLLWLGPSEATPDEVAFSQPLQDQEDGSSKLDEVVSFLNLLPDESPRKANDVKAEARQEGISATSLKRAKGKLKFKSTRVNPTGEERGKGEWWWHYPHQVVSISETNELIVQDVQEVINPKG